MSSSPFESIKHTNELDQEFWLARELSDQLGYRSYANFVNVIEKARKACEQSGQRPEDHFQGFDDYIEQQNGIYKKIRNIRLSRYACYLVTQNADSRKSMVALGQSYFAMQTRMQELQAQHLEDQKRVMLRDEIKKHNKDLAKTARRAGVSNYGEFVDYGYKGLYGGLTNRDLHKKKGLEKNEMLLDHSNSEELAANLFRATQTEAMIRREGIRGQHAASMAHFQVGKKVRSTIEEIGGTMPEDLPKVEHVREAEKRIEQTANSEQLPANSEKGHAKNITDKQEESNGEELTAKNKKGALNDLSNGEGSKNNGTHIGHSETSNEMRTDSRPCEHGSDNQKKDRLSGALIFPFPNDIHVLSDIAKIITKNPGSIDIILGHESYHVSTTGLQKIQEKLYGQRLGNI